jgi:outer membrane protein
MKYVILSLLTAATFCSANLAETPNSQNKIIKICVVNFKQCVEKSKMGKQEQNSFDALKKQMENLLEEKEKALNEMATKFNDPDYLDSLSPEAETELKRKFRALNTEITQQQNQYYQTLQQTNFKVVQKLNDSVTKASEKVAKDNGYDLVLNEEGTFFYSPSIDLSEKVISMMDQDFDNDSQRDVSKGQKNAA